MLTDGVSCQKTEFPAKKPGLMEFIQILEPFVITCRLSCDCVGFGHLGGGGGGWSSDPSPPSPPGYGPDCCTKVCYLHLAMILAPQKSVTTEQIERDVTCFNGRVFIKTMYHLLTNCSQSILPAMVCRLMWCLTVIGITEIPNFPIGNTVW